MKKILIILVVMSVFSLIFFTHINVNAEYEDKVDVSTLLKEEILNQNAIYNYTFNSTDNYYAVYQQWLSMGIEEGSSEILVTPEMINGGKIDELGVRLEPGDKISFIIDILDEGLYSLYLDYYMLSDTRVNPTINLMINQVKQFSEMSNIELSVDWIRESEKRYDRYGDELTPKAFIAEKWYRSKGLADPNHFFSEPLKFYFLAGENEVTLTLNEGYLVLGNIKIQNVANDMPTYEEYLRSYPHKDKIKTLITIEAEDYLTKNRQSIRAKYMRDPQVTPYAYKNRILNVLDGYSYGDSGDRVTYSFKVNKAGFYNIALKYYLNTNNGLPSFRRIEIDGNVPFEELSHYRFNYSSNWKNEVLIDSKGKPYEFYFDEGEHTISLVVDNVLISDIYHDLIDVLDAIQTISKNINKITGGLEDKERTWKITTYLPTLADDLTEIRDSLDNIINRLTVYTQDDDIPVIQELKIVRKLINEFIKDPEELPAYMTKFSKGETSAHGRINQILPTLIYHPLHLDKLYVYQNMKLPKPNANIFKRLIEGTRAFIYSFFDPKYNQVIEVDEDTISIWVNKSRLYVEIMQRMIDEEFTPKTGIKVQLSIMPDENKIILSNAAGTTPDGVMGISFMRPFELAIRGVIEDLREYEGFYELAEEFNPSTFVPYIYNDGVYAFPETQDVKLLFYRKDIFAELGVTPPDTWDDVITLVPILQKYDMNFYVPIGDENSYKGFDKTTPFIYQFGGLLYDEKTMTTAINREAAYQAFELMTDLFTVYNLPVSTANFFQHFRTGIIPVGIGDANMYIQLKYAAPELAGLWGITPIPGVRNEEGIVERWDPTYGSSSIIFKNSKKKEQTWELVKWWSSKETQADFSYNIQATLGNKFLYMTANIEGFKMSAWPNDSKDVILEQWQWIQATGKVPGDYMLERELSNAWNKVVFDGINPRIAIDEAKITIDLELERKLIEFGYMDNQGRIIKKYQIPTIHNIEKWVRRRDED
ncbi:MAG: extracellular solute-binding protein [Bacilli bacterium]|nr:extracellular solute-binding protein [Bacilli bacterium]